MSGRHGWWIGLLLCGLMSRGGSAQTVEDFTLFELIDDDSRSVAMVSMAESCQGLGEDQRYILVPANGSIRFVEGESERLNLWLAPLECIEEQSADKRIKRWRKYWIQDVLKVYASPAVPGFFDSFAAGGRQSEDIVPDTMPIDDPAQYALLDLLKLTVSSIHDRNLFARVRPIIRGWYLSGQRDRFVRYLNQVLDRETPEALDQRPVVVYEVDLPIDLAELVQAETVERMRAREPVKDRFFLGVEIDNVQRYQVQVNINQIAWGPDAPLYRLSFLPR